MRFSKKRPCFRFIGSHVERAILKIKLAVINSGNLKHTFGPFHTSHTGKGNNVIVFETVAGRSYTHKPGTVIHNTRYLNVFYDRILTPATTLISGRAIHVCVCAGPAFQVIIVPSAC